MISVKQKTTAVSVFQQLNHA